MSDFALDLAGIIAHLRALRAEMERVALATSERGDERAAQRLDAIRVMVGTLRHVIYQALRPSADVVPECDADHDSLIDLRAQVVALQQTVTVLIQRIEALEQPIEGELGLNPNGRQS